MLLKNKMNNHQTGLSLVEIMVGLVIGLLATLVIMQVFSTFEGQKRTTTGNADAQTNGGLAIYSIQREVQMAGFGLPIFDKTNTPLLCNPTVTIDHDSNGATPTIDLFPLSITNGAAGASDSIAVRYSTDGASSKGGIAVKVVAAAPAPDVAVDNSLGCKVGDVAIISTGSVCRMTKVTAIDADLKHITVVNAAGAGIGSSIGCMGAWNQFTFAVVNNQLQRNDASSTAATPILSDIVDMQAQYGISATANDSQIAQWVDASGAWAAPSVANRNRIKAVHIAVVARNGLLEKDNVTNVCTTAQGTANNGPCAWDDAALPSAAPAIDLSTDVNWQKYRYRVYDMIIPLRNIIWSRELL